MTAWTDFVSEHRKKHPTLSYKQALIDCKPLYGKQHGRGVLSDLLINKVKNQAPVKTMEDMTKMVKLFKVGLKNRKEGIPKGSIISNVGTTNKKKITISERNWSNRYTSKYSIINQRK